MSDEEDPKTESISLVHVLLVVLLVWVSVGISHMMIVYHYMSKLCEIK